MTIRRRNWVRKKKKKWVAVGDVLGSKSMGKVSGLVLEHKIRSAWNEIVGEALAVKTVPAKLYRDTLTINVASSVLSNQLYFLKTEIIEKIKRVIGPTKVRDLRFKVRPILKTSYGNNETERNTEISSEQIELSKEADDIISGTDLPPEAKRIMRNILIKVKSKKKP